jgi:uncharacterized protein YegL
MTSTWTDADEAALQALQSRREEVLAARHERRLQQVGAAVQRMGEDLTLGPHDLRDVTEALVKHADTVRAALDFSEIDACEAST